MFAFVGHHILEQNPAMRADTMEGNPVLIEKAHEIGTRDVKKLRRLLRRQLRLMRNQANRIAACHFSQDRN